MNLSSEANKPADPISLKNEAIQAIQLFLKDPNYADHRKITLAMIVVFILIGMLIAG